MRQSRTAIGRITIGALAATAIATLAWSAWVGARANELIVAAGRGDDARVSSLLAGGVPVDSTSNTGRTALTAAAMNGQLHTVNLLLKHKAGLRLIRWRRAASGAAFGGQVEILGALMKARPEHMKHAGVQGELLQAAAEGGQTAAVAFLLRYGVSPDARKLESGRTPLYLALERSHVDTAAYLIQHGASPNTDGPDGRTPLHLAVPWPVLVRSLLQRGADPTRRDNSGKRAIDYAVEGHFNSVKDLSRLGHDGVNSGQR